MTKNLQTFTSTIKASRLPTLHVVDYYVTELIEDRQKDRQIDRDIDFVIIVRQSAGRTVQRRDGHMDRWMDKQMD